MTMLEKKVNIWTKKGMSQKYANNIDVERDIIPRITVQTEIPLNA